MQMAIIGICGKMGSRIYEFYKDKYEIVGIDLINHNEVKTYQSFCDLKDIDIVIDFSSTDCFNYLKEALARKIPVLSGTTGYCFEQIEQLRKLALKMNTIFIWKANYAKGIELFTKLVEECKSQYSVLDFVEIHATTKKDAPSGTAKVLAKKLGIDENKIQSLRVNMAPAIHEIIFSSENERLILRHEIIDKKAFLEGFDEELNKIIRS